MAKKRKRHRDRLRVHVTANTIALARRKNLCPFAVAIANDVAVDSVILEARDLAWVDGQPAWLPAEEEMRIAVYDITGEIQPHTFRLDFRINPPHTSGNEEA